MKGIKKNTIIVGLVLLIFFVISFLTNILGALNPTIETSYNLGFSSLGFMTLAFFSAYGIMSIPAGILVDKFKEKATLVFAFSLASLGSFIFAFFPIFPVFLGSLFLIGAGMAILQVAINPLLRTAGGEENFAFNSVLGQLFFGAAGVAGPYLFTYLVIHVGQHTSGSGITSVLTKLVPQEMNWLSIYLVFGLVSALMTVCIVFFRFPRVILKKSEKAGNWAVYKILLTDRRVLSFFLAIFCYVGFEQGVSFWISQFLMSYHQLDPITEGAAVAGNFWGFLTIGCIVGLVMLKFIDSKKVLLLFSFLAFLSLLFALTGPVEIAVIAFPAVGFFISVVWSILFSLGLNSMTDHHGSVAGILCSGIIGGAITPLIIGVISDVSNLKVGLMFNFLLLVYIFSVGIWAKPLIQNKTI